MLNAGLGALLALVLVRVAARYAREGRVWLFDVAVGVVVCAAALLRDRLRGWAPVFGLAVAGTAGLVAVVAGLPGEPGGAAVLGLLVLAGTAVRSLPARRAAGVAFGGVTLFAGGLFGVEHTAGASTTAFRIGLQLWCVGLGCGLGLRFRDHRRRAMAESVRRDERLALARELHDVVAHHITGVVLQAQGARIVARRNPEQLDGTLAGIEAAGTEALAAMRRVVGLLRDAEDAVGTASGPEQLVDLVRRFEGHGPAVRLDQPTGTADWPPEVTSTVHRIVQEGLTNIARHAAHARSAVVSVRRVDAGVAVEVRDDAPPVSVRPPRPGGFGLIGMRERVAMAAGKFRAGPTAAGGFEVFARLPLDARPAPALQSQLTGGPS